MGLLEPYVYETNEKKKFWLHMRRKGKVTLYYFSKNRVGALYNIPKGYEVVKSTKMNVPMLKKKAGGGILGGFGKKSKPEEKPEAPTGTQEVKSA
jgi:hypothetical protein